MIKIVSYAGSMLRTYEIEGVPHADMEMILSLAIKGSWGDYLQVLNSSDALVEDLDLKCIDEIWLVPVIRVSQWLFSFSIRNMSGDHYDRFRIFRRDVEDVMRVAWALPVENYLCRNPEVPYAGEGQFTIWDIANVFLSYGLRDEELEGSTEEGEMFGPVHYIEYIAGCTSCGPRGYLLCEQIQYIEDMPNGDAILNHLDEILKYNLIPPAEYLDDYLDDINTFISLEATRFVGEL